jgi:hypothetical protein
MMMQYDVIMAQWLVISQHGLGSVHIQASHVSKLLYQASANKLFSAKGSHSAIAVRIID